MRPSLNIPPHLKRGDKVAAISLSWGGAGEPQFQSRYHAGIKAMEHHLGVKVVEMQNTLKGSAFIYENIRARVDDLHQAFSDPEIKAVISCVGGDDAIRLIDLIDFDLLKNNPKIFTGYSDSTVLHFICLKAGMRSYYGPHILTSFAGEAGPHPYLINSFKKTLFTNHVIGDIYPSPEGWMYEDLNWVMPEDKQIKAILFPPLPRKFIQGKIRTKGHLIGGCTDIIALMNGSSIWPAAETWEGAILFLENFGGSISPDTFLSILRNLGAQGILSRINGIIFGRPDRVPIENFPAYDAMLIKATAESGRSDMPIVTQLGFGHTEPAFIIPYGAMACIDPEKKMFSIDESGCV